MVVKTARDVEKLQEEMSRQFERFLEAARPAEERGGPADDPQVLIEQARASLAAAIRDKEEGLRMADLRIERRKQALASLENNVRHAEQPPDKPADARKVKARTKAKPKTR